MSDVSFILVYVDDVAASEAFYASILGRGAVKSSPTFAMLPAAPGLMLGLWKRGGVQPPASVAGGGEIAFTAADKAEVDALYAEVARARRKNRAGRHDNGFRLHLRRDRSGRDAASRFHAGGELSRSRGKAIFANGLPLAWVKAPRTARWTGNARRMKG